MIGNLLGILVSAHFRISSQTFNQIFLCKYIAVKTSRVPARFSCGTVKNKIHLLKKAEVTNYFQLFHLGIGFSD